MIINAISPLDVTMYSKKILCLLLCTAISPIANAAAMEQTITVRMSGPVTDETIKNTPVLPQGAPNSLVPRIQAACIKRIKGDDRFANPDFAGAEFSIHLEVNNGDLKNVFVMKDDFNDESVEPEVLDIVKHYDFHNDKSKTLNLQLNLVFLPDNPPAVHIGS